MREFSSFTCSIWSSHSVVQSLLLLQSLSCTLILCGAATSVENRVPHDQETGLSSIFPNTIEKFSNVYKVSTSPMQLTSINLYQKSKSRNSTLQQIGHNNRKLKSIQGVKKIKMYSMKTKNSEGIEEIFHRNKRRESRKSILQYLSLQDLQNSRMKKKISHAGSKFVVHDSKSESRSVRDLSSQSSESPTKVSPMSTYSLPSKECPDFEYCRYDVINNTVQEVSLGVVNGLPFVQQCEKGRCPTDHRQDR